MSAEGNLYNPALFSPATTSSASATSSSSSLPPNLEASSSSSSSALPLSAYLTGAHPRHTTLALEYLEIVKAQQTQTPLRCVKGHLFKLLKPALSRETDLRERLGRVRYEKPETAMWEKYEEIVKELDERMQVRLTRSQVGSGLCVLSTRAARRENGRRVTVGGARDVRSSYGPAYSTALVRATIRSASTSDTS